LKAKKVAEQAGQVVESVVYSYLKALEGKTGHGRGVLRPLFGLVTLAGGAAAVYYAQADEQEREQALGKVNELSGQLRERVDALTA
jgi:hypothetical protein